MGLLDDFSGFVKTPEGQGLLAAVAGGLAGARRGTPLNNIGRAGVAGLTGYANANEQINQDSLRKLQNEQLGLSVAEMKRKQEADAQAREVMKEYFGQGGLPNSSISPGLLAAQNAASPYQLAPPSIAQPPVTNQSPAIAQTPVTSQTQNTITPKTDLYLTYKNASDALARKGLIEQAKQYADMAEKNRPKFSTTPQKMVVGGKLTNVLVSEDGSVKTLDGYEVPPEMVSTELGGRVVWSDKNQIKPGQTMSKTATPGELMADARSREQFAFNKSQAGAKPQFHDGQWVYPPTADSPQGAAVPAKGFAPKMTDSQSKAALFGTRAQESHAILGNLEKGGTTVSVPGSNAGYGVGAILNPALSENQQKLNQAKRDFVNATLRRESGAVITPSEFENASKQYFPQVGDSEGVIQQKSRNREIAVRGMLSEVPNQEVIDKIAGKAKPLPDSQSAQNQQALDWANANPSDPRAAAIKKRLGM
jgi:hypothetical protein